VVSTWSIWEFEEMAQDPDEPGLWSLDAQIRYPEFEEFQIVLDHDLSKVIHPEVPLAGDESIPIVGPDATGTGYNFMIRGPADSDVRLRFKMYSSALDDVELRVLNVTYPLTKPKVWRTSVPASPS